MMALVTGKIALVTGASAGIGAAIAEKLVKEGVTVIGCARNVDRIKALCDKLRDLPGSLIPMKCDVTNESDVVSMFREIKEKHGGLDICINNAGVLGYGSLMDGKTDIWKQIMDVNVLGLSICTREALKSFEVKGVDGHIVNMGSVVGHIVLGGAFTFYCACKWMVKTLTECLRQELREKKKRTRVSMISPGYVKTEIYERAYDEEESKKVYAEIEYLHADQMADAVYFSLTAAGNMEVNDIIVRPTGQIP